VSPRPPAAPGPWALLAPQRIAAREAARALWGWRLPLLGALALLCAVGCYLLGDLLFGQIARLELLAPLLMRKTMGFILDFFVWSLTFSTAISAFSTLYLAQDLPRLLQSPVPLPALAAARVTQAWAQTSWMLLLFALPLLAGAGVRLGAPASFHLTLLLCLTLISVSSAALASCAALVFARLVPAKRLQDAMVLILLTAFVYFYLRFQASDPARFFREDGFRDLMEMVRALRGVGGERGLSAWAVQATFATLDPARSPYASEAVSPLPPLSLLAATTVALCALCVTLARWLYLSGFWLAQEGIGGGERSPGLLTRRRARAAVAPSPAAALARRDWRQFWRTPAQWTQLLLIGSLVGVYVFNFQHLNAGRLGDLFSPALVFFVHVFFSGLVLTTLCARFLYPSVSGEGKALWVLASAPVSAREVLRGKLRWGLPPILGLAVALSLVGGYITRLSAPWLVCLGWASCCTSVAVAGLNVGLGAAYPKLHLPNPMEVSSSLGGVVCMLLSLFSLALFALCAYPCVLAIDIIGPDASFGDAAFMIQGRPALFALLATAVSGAIYLAATWWGARRLAARLCA